MLTYSSPKHFVVCHVLLHQLMPRHSPYALIHLITIVNPNLMRFYSIKSIMTIFCSFTKIVTTLSSFQRTFLKELHSFKTKQNISFIALFLFVYFFLHRKEVIHPHVLVGIPCYDFTPITCPTLNGPLLKG